MAAETKVNVQKLKDVGTLIGQIIEDYRAPITDLGKVVPNAGKFDAAQWIEDLFVDRRDAVTTHVKYLELAFGEIRDGLIQIATEFDGIDAANADAVAKFTASAKNIITGMGKGDFEVVMSKSKVSYETGDDTQLGDQDTFDFSDPNHPKILDFDPAKVPGMSEFMTPDELGKGNDKTIDLNNQSDLSGNKTIDVGAGPEPKPDPKPGDTPGPGAPPPPPPPLVELKDKGDSDEGVDGEKDWGGKTYRYYLDDAGNHQSHNGNKIWWMDGKAYLSSDGGGHFVEYHTANGEGKQDPPPRELKVLNEHNQGLDGETDWGGNTYRYYNDDSGQQQTHNGNKIWWMNGKTYVQYSSDDYVTFVEYKY